MPIDPVAIDVAPSLPNVPILALSSLTLDFKYKDKHIKSRKFTGCSPPPKDTPVPTDLRPCNLGAGDPRRYNVPVYVSSDDTRAPSFGLTEVTYYVEGSPAAPVACYYLKKTLPLA